MDIRLPIRLSIVEGESLSGYIIRSARAMDIDCNVLLKYIISNYNIHYKIKDNKINIAYSKIASSIDVFPFGILKEDGVCAMFNKSKEEIESATFSNILDVLNVNYDAGIDPYKMYLNRELIKDVRRFCPLCLKDNGVYKLIWQIKEIEICYIHKIKLVSHCGVCNFEQKYFSSRLGKYSCSNCNSLLWENVDRNQPDIGKLSQQKINYKNWNFLLRYKNRLINLIPNYNFEQSLAITMLYIAQNQENIFYINNINKFHKKTISNIVRFVNDIERGMKISLNGIKRITSYNNILLSNLPNIKVPISYIQSLIKEKKRKVSDFTCISPWCNFFGSSDRIYILGKYHSKDSKVMEKFVCTQCYMRFVYNSKNNTCEAMNKTLFTNIPKVKELLLQNQIQKEIVCILGISTYLYVKILAYLLLNNMLNDNIKSKEHIIIPADIKDKFKTLIDRKCFSDKKGSEIFGWSCFQFHYYYWLPETQRFLFDKEKHGKLRIGPNIPKRKDWTKELKIALRYLEKNNIDITYGNINKYFHISWRMLKKYQLIDIVKISIMLQKSKRRLEYDIDIIKKVNNYLDNSKYKKVYLEELFTQTKINKDYIKKHYPNLEKNVVRKVRVHNSEVKKQKLENYKKEIKKIYLNSIENGEIETIRSISSKLEKDCKFISKRPELNDFTKKLLEHGINTESDN
ncbi:TniQ family protein [Clostridium diolis]|uniref:TniQ family protein n=1 Tax=Clostridium diolis TaxID=223919 RepID=UPI003AF8BAEE